LWQFVYHHHCNFLQQRTYKLGMRMSAISCCKQRTYRCAPGCLAELTLLIYRTFVIQLWPWSCLSDFVFFFYT
jgi:hypothetical protein